MAGQGSQVAGAGNELAAAENLGGGVIGARRICRFAREQAGDDVLAFLGLQRAGAIDQRAARFGQRDGVLDQPPLQRGELCDVRGVLEPRYVGVAADGARRGARRVDQNGIKRLGRPFGDIRADKLGCKRQAAQIFLQPGEACRRAIDRGDAGARGGKLRGLAAGRRAQIGDAKPRDGAEAGAPAERPRRPEPTTRLRQSPAAPVIEPCTIARTDPVGNTRPPSRAARGPGSFLTVTSSAGSRPLAAAISRAVASP